MSQDWNVEQHLSLSNMGALRSIARCRRISCFDVSLMCFIRLRFRKAKTDSEILFGRARLIFVAQNRALECLLRPGTNAVDELKLREGPGMAVRSFLGRIFRWIALISLLATPMYAEVGRRR
jgi:hypothetical protein